MPEAGLGPGSFPLQTQGCLFTALATGSEFPRQHEGPRPPGLWRALGSGSLEAAVHGHVRTGELVTAAGLLTVTTAQALGATGE